MKPVVRIESDSGQPLLWWVTGAVAPVLESP